MLMKAEEEEKYTEIKITQGLRKSKKDLKKYLGRRTGSKIFNQYGQQPKEIITLIDILLSEIKKESWRCLPPSYWALLTLITTTIEKGVEFWKIEKAAPDDILSALLTWKPGEGEASEACASTPSRK